MMSEYRLMDWEAGRAEAGGKTVERFVCLTWSSPDRMCACSAVFHKADRCL